MSWTFDAIKHDYYVKSRYSKILLALVNIITVILSVLNIVFKKIYSKDDEMANKA